MTRRLPGACLAVSMLVACGAPATPRAPAAPASVAPPAPTPPEALAIPVGADDATLGDANAPVTIVTFVDFEDPYSSRIAGTLRKLAESDRASSLRIVVKHCPLPFHPLAELAARIAEGVRATRGNAAFFQFFDLAFERPWRTDAATLRAWAVRVGADAAAIERGLEAGTWNAKVAADLALAKKLGVQGTPHSFVNGRSLGGAQPSERFEALIQTERAAAAELTQRGVPARDVYRTRLSANFVAPLADPPQPLEDSRTVWNVPVRGAPARGPETALVTLVEFGDFQSPFCGKVEPVLARLRTTYGDKLRMVWKDMPQAVHPRARPAAMLAREARAQMGEAGFWAVHDGLLASQPKLEEGDFEQVATAAGLNVSRAKAAIAKGMHAAVIDADAEVASALAAETQLTFFVNGRRLRIDLRYESFAAVIDEEIGRSQALLAKGVAPQELYTTLMAEARSAPESTAKLVQVDTKVGKGRAAKSGDVVTMHYTGTLEDGREFDSSRTRGAPMDLQLGQGLLIKGWEQGIPGMKVGGRRTLTVPPHLAYGKRGRPGSIPPNATLIFDVELVKIK